MFKKHPRFGSERTVVLYPIFKKTAIALFLSAASATLSGQVFAGPYVSPSSASGEVSIDAADFDASTAKSGHQWRLAYPSGYTGTAAVEAYPNDGTLVSDAYAANSPRLDYQIDFEQPGTYYVWVYGIGASGHDDSVHVGVDGTEVASAAAIDRFGSIIGWSNKTMSHSIAAITVPTAGVHTLNLWMREDGFIADKIVITRDGAFTPSGEGPALSTRSPGPETTDPTALIPDANGMVSIDVADYDTLQAGNNHGWVLVSQPEASGKGALEALPNTGARIDSGYATSSPRADYAVYFRDAGTYYVWIRGLGRSGEDDSVHVGIDGQELSSAAAIDRFNASFGWSNKTMGGNYATVDVATPGVHMLNLWMREDGFIADKIVITRDGAFTPSGEGPALSTRSPGPVTTTPTALVADVNGMVSIDVADYDTRQAANNHEWVTVSQAGASGKGALEALPNTGARIDSGYAASSPQADYAVYFRDAGTYYVWVRGLGLSGEDDSVHVGLDGQELSSASAIDRFNASFGWSNKTMGGNLATVDVATPGVHTVNLWMREDGFMVDKIVLVPSVSYVPTGEGPAPSPRTTQGDIGGDPGDGGSEPVDTQPWANPDSTTTPEATPVLIDVLANDSGLDNTPVIVSVSGPPSNGLAQVQSDNRVLYAPQTGYYGSDSFTYSVTDADGDRAMSSVTIHVECVGCLDGQWLTVSWSPNQESVLGYRVYTGSGATSVTTELSDLSVASGSVDPTAPSVRYNVAEDLELRAGSTACFKVTAYNDVGTSAPSQSACVNL